MLGTEWPCPHTGDICQNASCPATACIKDMDGCEPDDDLTIDCSGMLAPREREGLFGFGAA